MNNSRYVQYGCGWSAPSGWRNFDASPTLRFERLPLIGKLYSKNKARFPENIEFGDIVQGLPVADSYCAGVYCSHVLEHLSLEGCRAALRNTLRMLQPSGTFRLVLPDLEHSVKSYLANPSTDAVLEFMKETCLGHEKRATGLIGFAVSWLGNSHHLWMWDYKSMEVELKNAGFVEIRRASFGDSIDPAFGQVEESDRWNGCLGVECKRPDYSQLIK